MDADTPNVLLVDDLDANLIALEALLRDAGATLLKARSGSEALEILLRQEVALALLDVQMPEMDGFQLAALMRGTERTRAIPIIFITAGAGHDDLRFQGYELGAVDFLTKPIMPVVLRSKVNVFLELARQRARFAAVSREKSRLVEAHAEAERRARESEAHLQRVLDNVLAFVAVLAPDGALLGANRAPLAAVGGEVVGVLGRKFWDFPWWNHSGEAQAQLREACARAAAGETVRYDAVLRAADDSRLWIDFQIAPLRDGAGRITHLVSSGLDITARRNTEQALAHERAMLESLLEACPTAVVMADADGALLRVNAANIRLWGRAPAIRSVKEYGSWKGWWADGSSRHGRRLQPHEWAMARALRGEVVAGDLIEIEPFGAPEGARRALINAGAPVYDPSGRLIGGVVAQTDVTALRDAQAALQRAQETIQQHAHNLERVVAERTAKLQETVQELEAFSYSIAHDMRAPLRSMLGYSDLLIEEQGERIDPEGRDYLGRIRSSARRLDSLIQDVLNYSRIVRENLSLCAVDARALVVELVETYPNLRAVAGSIEIEADIPRVRANPAALTQVLSNLLSNAVKFTRPGLAPRVRVRGERVPPGELPTGATGSWARLWVEDNGIGLDPEVQPRLFQMFQRFTRPGLYEGTGIGLAIARKATERMGGSIGVLSTPGEGSRFWIQLPSPD